MENIIEQIIDKLPIVLQILGGLVIAVTAGLKLTPKPEDDVLAESFANKFFKAISYLPSIGINPRTAKIEEAYKAIRAEVKIDETLPK